MRAYKRINKRVIERGITRSELSRRTGIPYELLRRSLDGTRKMTADELVLLCRELDLDVADFSEKGGDR
jgi:DNA-binding Xre family transcriptional regulator